MAAHNHRHGGALGEGNLLEPHAGHRQRFVDVEGEQLAVEPIE